MAKAKATIDHKTIKRWVEDRDGCPAHVKDTADDGIGILRIDYTGFSGKESLEAISWEEFFEAFEENELAFLYQDEGDSRFSKLVSRDTVDLESEKEEEEMASDEETGEAIDPIELLESQHREVEDLFEELEEAGSTSKKREVFHQLANALAAHSKIEEMLFYPEMFDEDTEDELRESVEEHLLVKRMIADMLDMTPSEPQFEAKTRVLKEIVEHHVEEEEAELFEVARAQDAEDLQDLGARMQELYAQLMEGEPIDELRDETQAAAPLS